MHLTRQLSHCPCEFASRVGFWIEDSKDGARVCVKCNSCCRTGASFAVDEDLDEARVEAMKVWNGMIRCATHQKAA
jgi:hypothetical protein